MSRVVRLIGIGAALMICSAHVGSPDAWFDGFAGPYPVLVHVETPLVIPGIAGINVRASSDGIDQVTAFVNRFDATGGAPPPEIAEPVAGRPGWYRTELWVMTGGSNSVTIEVTGARGKGTAVVPVVAVPVRRLGFNRALGAGLGALGVVLVAGILTIVGAAVRESVLPPGLEPDSIRRRAAARAMSGTGVAVALLLFGGWRWWGAEDAGFVRSMFRPMASDASITDSAGRAMLTLAVRDSAWIRREDPAWVRTRGASRRTPLIADHGKLMHLFLIGDGGRAFAHLHPGTIDSVRFTSPLPPVPPGRYDVFGDIVHESGLTQTLVSSVTVERDGGASTIPWMGDPDNAWSTRPPRESMHDTLDDGSTITWLRGDGPLASGADAALRFAITPPTGTGAHLEAYMGMAGHAVVARDDGSVFVHLHPSGTISMAAQRAFEMRGSGDTIPGMLARRLGARVGDSATSHAGMRREGDAAAISPARAADTLAFPYAFPEPGRYFVWVQVKREGRVSTASFVARVGPRS
jgi:hypothetical protein